MPETPEKTDGLFDLFNKANKVLKVLIRSDELVTELLPDDVRNIKPNGDPGDDSNDP